MLPHYPPDAMRHTMRRDPDHMAEAPSPRDGCGDTVHSTLTCHAHALSHAAADAQHLDCLERLDARLLT